MNYPLLAAMEAEAEYRRERIADGVRRSGGYGQPVRRTRAARRAAGEHRHFWRRDGS